MLHLMINNHSTPVASIIMQSLMQLHVDYNIHLLLQVQVRQPFLSITYPSGQALSIHFKYRHVGPEIKSSSCCYIIRLRGVEEGQLRGDSTLVKISCSFGGGGLTSQHFCRLHNHNLESSLRL